MTNNELKAFKKKRAMQKYVENTKTGTIAEFIGYIKGDNGKTLCVCKPCFSLGQAMWANFKFVTPQKMESIMYVDSMQTKLNQMH